MRVTYDKRANAMYIKMSDGLSVSTRKITDKVIVDLNENGDLIGIELLEASTYIEDVDSVDYQVLTESVRPDPEVIKARREAIAKVRRKKQQQP